MLSLIEQIRIGSLWDFPGGVHPAENKKQSNQTPLVHASLPAELVLPLKQHIGRAGRVLVSVGDRVLKGQPLTDSDAGFTLPVHAPTSGTVKALENRTVAHPSGLSELCAVIVPDGEEQWFERTPVADYTQETSDHLLDVIRLAGISGMGGAGFPTAKKLQSGLARTEILIINAAECEPYITSDDTLLQEHADEVLQGIEVVEHILKPKLTIVGIEDNKPAAIAALQRAALNKDIVIRVIPTKYPSGGEKQLIKILTDLEVPVGGIPADIGVMVQNVGSLYAIKRAILDGEPLINRVVTLTGNTFAQPRNVWALLGTPVQALLDEFDYTADKRLPRLIMGGPMMGFTLPHSQVPITKTSNCILAPSRREISDERDEMACIRCSSCAEACPVSLLPQQLQWHAKAKEYDKLQALNLKDCIECGACAFVCPSEIPLVQYYRQAKAEMREQAQEAQAAERAKQRFEEKKARVEREKAERENRFKKAAEDRRQEMKSSAGTDAIAAAIARVKAQKTDAQAQPELKPAVAAAIAKAKAKQAQAAQAGADEPDNSEMAKLREERKRLARERKAEKAQNEPASDAAADKQSAVAAAIARAKAKKAEQQQESSPAAEPENKQAAVAAAIARAKARKAKQAAAENADADADVTVDATGAPAEAAGDPKKAAVAAAIARAKARKAKQEATENADADANTDAPLETVSVEAADDPKKAAVAAAIARAKARKAKQQAAENADTDANADVTVDAADTPVEVADDPKKAAVAAAIARAKARKAKQQAAENADANANAPLENMPVEATDAPVETADAPVESTDDPKKAAVAAAIARAKARKAQRDNSNNEENE